VQLPAGYYFLPDADKLPVVVATRMSLSFPILLSAVRLYTIRPSANEELRRQGGGVVKTAQMQEHWFSDGGITSNFPIHMFDSWRPTHPTFGIKLHGWLSPTPEDVLRDRKLDDTPLADPFAATIEQYGVYLPQPNDTLHGGHPVWKPVESVWRFIGNIVDTMQNFRDNTQSQLPGYRERIAQVYLKEDEGGLNLDMPQHAIEAIIAKGRKAGEAFTNGPNPAAPQQMYFDFDQHQWVRFRVFMAQLEREVSNLRCSLSEPNAASQLISNQLIATYDEVINKQLCAYNGERKWYRPMNGEECEQAKKRVEALWQFIQQWEEATEKLRADYNDRPEDNRPRAPFPPGFAFFQHNAPIPPSVLRITPEL
jgi:hypothetical protein